MYTTDLQLCFVETNASNIFLIVHLKIERKGQQPQKVFSFKTLVSFDFVCRVFFGLSAAGWRGMR